jgi:glycosyltransferase involved in cell wall biosynthesis
MIRQSRRKRILLVNTGMAYGGVEVYLLNLVRLLKDDAEFYMLCSNPELESKLAGIGVKSLGFLGAGRWFRLIICLAMFPLLRFRRGIDIVWVQGGVSGVVLPISRLCGCRTIATRHKTLEMEVLGWRREWKNYITEFLYRRLAGFAHRTICVSHAVADAMKSILPARKIAVIPNWVPQPAHPLWNPSHSGGAFRLLFVGRLERHKGAALIIQAMHRLKAQGVSRNLKLTIVGDGDHRIELQRMSKGLDVEFAGFQDDPARFYHATDVFINPTLGAEGLPLVSLEAMSYGTPCIFSNIRIHMEVLGGVGAALLFESGDISDLAAKIESARSSPELLNQLSYLARRRFQDEFSSEIAVDRYIKELRLTPSLS